MQGRADSLIISNYEHQDALLTILALNLLLKAMKDLRSTSVRMDSCLFHLMGETDTASS